MAVNERQIQDLLNSINTLVKAIEGKNSAAKVASSRQARGGLSNGKKIEERGNTVEVLAEDLKDLHKSFKSGGKSIADHFKSIAKSVNPLEKAFEKLEDVVNDAVKSQSKIYGAAARQFGEYVKSVKGNVDKIQSVNQRYTSVVKGISDIVNRQSHYLHSQKELNDLIAKIRDQEADLAKEGILGPLTKIGPQINKWIDTLVTEAAKPVAKRKELDIKGISTHLNELEEQHKAVTDISGKFIGNLRESLNHLNSEIKKVSTDAAKKIGAALITEGKKFPDFVTSRLFQGFQANEFWDAFRIGMSPQELNEVRASTRDVMNAMSQFGKAFDQESTENLKNWSLNARQIGLTGKEAADYTAKWMRTAYQTGQQYNDIMNVEMTRQAQQIQQVFGGSITDAAAIMQDYSTQIYNIARFNKARTDEERTALQKELTTRLQLTKYLGYDVEYMKQQEQLRHNAKFGDVTERIRGAVMGEVGAQMLASKLGWSEEDKNLWSYSQRPGADLNKLSTAQRERLATLSADFTRDFYKTEDAATAVNAGVGGFTSALAQNAALYRIMNQGGGENIQQIVEAETRAAPMRTANAVAGSFEDFREFARINQQKQEESFGIFERAVMEFKGAVGGIGGLPGSALAGAVGGGALQIAGALLKRRIGMGGLGSVFGGGGGSALGSARGAMGTASRVGKLGLRATGGVAGAGLLGWGVGSGLSSWGEDAYYGEDGLYKTASKFLNPLGYGAQAVSNFFSDRNTDRSLSVVDRVAQTGIFTQDDIDALVKSKSVGDWWVSDADRAQRVAEATAQLTQLAEIANRRKANTTALDAPRTNAVVGQNFDSAAGIVRDENGNPIAINPNDPLNRMVAAQEKTVELLEDSKKEAAERDERREAIEERRSKSRMVQEHLANTYAGLF